MAHQSWIVSGWNNNIPKKGQNHPEGEFIPHRFNSYQEISSCWYIG